MNYEPNTIRWSKGAFILHDADAKEPKMLMRVIGYTRAGLCKTKYVESDQPRKAYENDLQYLHDPACFNLEYWSGYPVLVSEPKACPICGSTDIDTDRMPEDDECDEALAHQCGIHEVWNNLWEDYPEFLYNYAEMHCENEDCGAVIAYGERGYYDRQRNNYTHKKPSPLDYPGTEENAKAKAESERKAQEAASQQRLFGNAP